ncbi:serine-enriched protein-like [Haliotis asinina]|uniref:serine-enriched protein-like n=1 Tax=Haliotis asinina TaxID=109174 RepID=UPI003532054B
MNRHASRVCLLDNDVLEHSVQSDHESDVYDNSSSGYESSDLSDEETTALSSAFNSTHTQAPIGRCKPTQPSTYEDVMILKNTRELQDSLALILELPDMCDVKFLVGRNLVPVYGVKAILATRSRYLYQLILQEQKRAEVDHKPSKKTSKKSKSSPVQQKLCINVPDYDVDDFKAFLGFVHSGKADIRPNNVIGLLCAAVEFGFPDLQLTCTKFLEILQDKGHTSALLAYVWTYQHKPTGQKLISDQCNQVKLSIPQEVSVTAHPRDPVDDWNSRSRSSSCSPNR